MAANALATPTYWQQAITELSDKDAALAGVIAQVGKQCMVSRGEPFETLIRSVVGQQISVKAAHSIWLRVSACIAPNGEHLTPASVLKQSVDDLRACGLSGKKVEYIQDVAAHFQAGTVNPKLWHTLSDEALIQELIQVKGIGRWTAEMVLMFNALRPDVFPIDDLAVRKAMGKLYGFLDDKDGRKQMIAKSADWAPWRSVASWLLWRSLDLTPDVAGSIAKADAGAESPMMKKAKLAKSNARKAAVSY
jgi:DNA-3-methyladenine glycosylase II